MNAGQFDRRVTFQVRTGTQDSATGAYTYAWQDHATVWAQVQDYLRADGVQDDVSMASNPARIRVRWRDDITADMRIAYGERTLRIVSGPAEIGRREALQIVAEEFSTEGEAP